MVKKIILIVSIIVLILLCLFVYDFILRKKHNKKIEGYEFALEQSVEYLKERDNKIEELKKIKVKTVREFYYLEDEEKNREYEKLYNKCKTYEEIMEQDEAKIKELNKQLEDCTNNYKRIVNKKGITIEPFVLIGVKYKDINDMKVTPGIGAVISKTFDLKLIEFGIGGGGYGKIPVDDEKEWGFVAQIKIGF